MKRIKLTKILASSLIATLVLALNPIGTYATETITNAVQTTDAVVSTAESDFTFDSSTGKITRYKGTDTEVVIPCRIKGVPGFSVTSIGKHAFSNGVKSIEISGSIMNLDKDAFEQCSNLKNIIVNDSNRSYTSYDGVLFNKSKTEIINYPEGKDNTSYAIPNGVTEIDDSAFYKCSNSLTSITIPNGVTSIGNGAFQECSGLTSITIPSSVTSIGDEAFSDCSSLTSITIPNGETSIGNETFYDCTKLTSVIIPNSVTSIGKDAFKQCSSLTSITIPSSVTSIGKDAFYKCTNAKFYVDSNKVKELLINNGVDERKIILNA